MTHAALPSLALAAAVAGLTAFGALVPGTSFARDRPRAERIVVRADVIDVRPVYREVRYSEPRRECWTEEVRHVVREGRRDHYRPGRREHHDRYRRYDDRDRYRGESHRGSSHQGAIVGGLVGGVVGNQLGRRGSDGERAGATIAGAIIGSAVGNRASDGASRHRRYPRQVESRTVYETRPVQRCRTVEGRRSQRRLQHYDVTYAYRGQTYTTRLPRDPGPTLELDVTLKPARR